MKPKVRARAPELRGQARDFSKIKIWSIFLHQLGFITGMARGREVPKADTRTVSVGHARLSVTRAYKKKRAKMHVLPLPLQL